MRLFGLNHWPLSPRRLYPRFAGHGRYGRPLASTAPARGSRHPAPATRAGRFAVTASPPIGHNLSIRRAIRSARRPNRPARLLHRPVVGPICSAGGPFLADDGPNCPAGVLIRPGCRAIRPAGRQIWSALGAILSAVGPIRAARRLFLATGQQKGPANGAL